MLILKKKFAQKPKFWTGHGRWCACVYLCML